MLKRAASIACVAAALAGACGGTADDELLGSGGTGATDGGGGSSGDAGSTTTGGSSGSTASGGSSGSGGSGAAGGLALSELPATFAGAYCSVITKCAGSLAPIYETFLPES